MERNITDLVVALTEGRVSRRTFVIRAGALGLSVPTIGSLLAACGGSDEPTAVGEGGAVGAPAPKDVAGSIVLYKGPFSPTEPKQVGELITSFNTRYPGVRVRREQFDWEAMAAQFPTKFLSDSPPDVNTVPDLEYGKWVKRGVFEDLTPYVTHPSWKQQYDAIPQSVWATAKGKDGKIYGVPWWGVVLSMLFVNRDLMRRAGVTDVNSSFEAFHEAARKVKALDDKTFGFSIRTAQPNPAAFDWAAWLHAVGANLLNDDWTACAVDTPEAERALQLLADMQSKEKLSPAPGAYDQNGLQDLFRAGRVGSHHEGNDFNAILRDNPPKFEYDVAAIPKGSGSTPATGLLGVGLLTIARKSRNKPAAWELVKHLSSADQVTSYFQQVALLPTRTDLADRMYKNDPKTQKVLREIVPGVQGWQLHPKINEFLGRSQASFDSLYAGRKGAPEALKEVCATIEGLL